MATTLQAEARFSQKLQCPICLETFQRPKVLPCGHTYCAWCIQSHISKKVIHKGTPQVGFPCPVCRAERSSSDPNINIAQWTESLPVNNIVSSLLDVSVGQKAAKACDHCVKQGKESLATYLCKDCFQYMCKTCRQSPLLRGHDVIHLSDGDESSSVIPNISTIELCRRHSDEHIKLFCVDHNITCCNTCGFLEHRKCDRVIMIDDMLKSFDGIKISEKVDANLCKYEEHLKQIIRKIKVHADTIQKDKTDILEHIHSLKAQLIAKIQTLEDDVIASLESNYKSVNLNLQTQEDNGKSLITAIDSDRTQLELVIIHGSEVQKFIMLHSLDHSQRRYFRAISEYQNDIKEVRMTLDVDNTFRTFLNIANKIVKVNLICNKFDCSPCPDVFEIKFWKDSVSLAVRTPLREGKAVKVSEFNVKVSGDTNVCHISDIVHLKDSRILLVDKMNSKIKMFGQNYKYQENMTLQGNPRSACSLSDTEVAVTIPDHKAIQIIGITDKMMNVRVIRTRLKCWGIAVVKDHLVITTYGDEHSIIILDMQGKEIRTVRPNSYKTDKFLHPLYVKADTTNSVIYIPYHTGHKLVAYNMTWNVMFTYMNQDMANPVGIDTDREGNIYLCGYISQLIQHISTKGKIIKALISKKKEKKNPMMIRFYSDKDSFIVTFGHCDIVEVYDLRV